MNSVTPKYTFFPSPTPLPLNCIHNLCKWPKVTTIYSSVVVVIIYYDSIFSYRYASPYEHLIQNMLTLT
jgi:hypothetical protein